MTFSHNCLLQLLQELMLVDGFFVFSVDYEQYCLHISGYGCHILASQLLLCWQLSARFTDLCLLSRVLFGVCTKVMKPFMRTCPINFFYVQAKRLQTAF